MGKALKSIAIGVAIIGAAVLTGGVSLAPTVGALTATGVAIGTTVVTTAIGSIMLGMGVSMILSGITGALLAPSMPSIKGGSGGVAVNFRQPIVNATLVYGRAHVGGPIIFYHAQQGSDEYRYFVVTLAAHEVEAIESVLLNDVAVSIGAGGLIGSGEFANNAWVWPQTGAATDAPPAVFTSETGGRWTADHRGAGIAKLYFKFKLTDEIISGGMPKMTAIVKGKKVYDPRTEATAYSNNAALCFWDYMLLSRTDGGYGLEADEVDWDHGAAEANICDELVNLKSGSQEPRYVCDGVVDTGAGPDTVRDALLLTMAGDYAEAGPRVLAYAGAWRTTVTQLHPDDVVSSVQYRPLGSASPYVNEVRGVFLSEADKWQPVEFPTQRIEDGEEPQTVDLELAFVKSPTQAQRIARIMLNRARAERSLTWPMNIKGLNITPLDNVTISPLIYPHLSNAAFAVRGWGLSDQFGVTLNLAEDSPDFYEWNPLIDEQAINRPAISLVKVNAGQIGAGSGVSGLAISDGASAGELKIDFTMPATPGAISYSIRRAEASTDIASSTIIKSGAAAASQAVTFTDTGLTTATSYSYWVSVYTYMGSVTAPVGPVTRAAP